MNRSKVDAIKHPERMGPLGDKPGLANRGRKPQAGTADTPARKQAEERDREQVTREL